MFLQKSFEEVRSKGCTIEIFGLGYVGFPLAVRLAISGFKVIGIDTNSSKIERLRNYDLLDSEISLKNEFLTAIQNKKLIPSEHSLSTNNQKIGIICVLPPYQPKKHLLMFL